MCVSVCALTRQVIACSACLQPANSCLFPLPSLSQSQLSGGGEFKRPADRRSTPRDALGLESLDATPRAGAGLPALNGLNGLSVRGPGSLVVQRQVVDPRHREALRCMRLEVLQLEDVIPWNSVRRTWKTKVRRATGWVGGWVGERAGWAQVGRQLGIVWQANGDCVGHSNVSRSCYCWPGKQGRAAHQPAGHPCAPCPPPFPCCSAPPGGGR